LANHINTSLTKISHGRADSTNRVAHSAATSVDDELVDEWKFYDGELLHYDDIAYDELDVSHNSGVEMDSSSVRPSVYQVRVP
jgi:hypothetical protein